MKNQRYHTVGRILKSNIKIIGSCKIYTPSTQAHGCSLSWLGTGTSIEGGGDKLVVWAETHPRSENNATMEVIFTCELKANPVLNMIVCSKVNERLPDMIPN
jgi:hypothetical protein